MANVKANLLYSETHEWADIQGSTAKVGISDYRQDGLGELTYISLPEVGSVVAAGDKIADVETLKATAEILSPVAGKIVAVNSELEDAPNMINDDPYGSWICEIEVSDKGNLMDAAAYEKICE